MADPKVYFVDGSEGTQNISDDDHNLSYVDASNAAGIGDIIINIGFFDGFGGHVMRGNQIDAYLRGIDGVVAGSTPTIVIGHSFGKNTVFGGSGHLEFHQGMADNDATIVGGTTTTFVSGNITSYGDLTFYGRGTSDVMLGGAGNNTMACSADAASISLFASRNDAPGAIYSAETKDVVVAHGGIVTAFGGVEDLTLYGGSGTNTLIGDATPYTHDAAAGSADQTFFGTNTFVGGEGADAGTDILYAGVGVNVMFEGAGNSAFVGSAGNDYVRGGSGTSTIYGGSGTTFVETGLGNQYLQAGSGNTVLSETAANLTAGRADWIDHFKVADASRGTYINLPKTAQDATHFESLAGGTLVSTAATAGAGQAFVFVANTEVAQVQAQTFFV